MTEGSGPCGEDFYSGFLRGFPQFPVERGERRYDANKDSGN